MKRFVAPVAVAWTLMVASAPAPAADPAKARALDEATRRAVAGRNAFAIELLARSARSTGREDLAIAPSGLAELLATAREGASGETADQVDRVLRLDPGSPAFPAVDPAGVVDRATLRLGLASNDGYGVKLLDVPAGSAADRAGLKPGDLVLALDGRPVRSRARLAEAIDRSAPSGSARLQVFHVDTGLVDELTVPFDATREPATGLSTARSAWIQAGSAVPEAFRRAARDRHRAEVFEADFRGDPAGARAAIDAWLAGTGPGPSTPRLDPVDLGPDVRLVLLDRFALKASWARPFPEARPGEFRTIEGEAVAAPMMRQEGTFPVAEGKRFTVLELPFADGRRSLLVALPTDPATAPESLEAADFEAAVGGLKPEVVAVTLPKFRVRRSARLEADLAAMGMPRAFSDRAEFAGIDPREPLRLDAVRQSVAVEVDEAGAVAEATTVATAVAIRGPRREPRAFSADRPFLFFVVDRPSGLILLAGGKYRGSWGPAE